MDIKKVTTEEEAILLARKHAAEAMKEQTLYSHMWCSEDVACVYQLELYRMADEALENNNGN